ncbi:hypothetical protein MMPV_002540 [Pyropia vietnamensis]
MGVSGLLPVLRPITERVNVSSFRGRRVGVDGFAWLHRGGYACALELATGAPTSGYLTHFLHHVNLLRHHGVIPVVVFDGAPLPMKADTNAERRASRAEAQRAGEAALAAGDRRAATEYFQRCVTVTPEMVAAVMGALRPLGIEAMVAPYEADAQLAFLAATGVVDAVITEDSDLVVYGVPTLLFKLSKYGDADRIRSVDLRDVPDPPMRHSTPDMLLWTAVLAGCDFFPGVPGLGVKRAHGLVRQFAGNLGRLLAFVSAEPRLRVPPTFISDFHRACLVFRHQVVWDPSTRRTVHLTPLSAAALQHVPPTMVATEDASSAPYSFLGVHPPPDVAAAVVRSELHPITHQQLVPRVTASAPVVWPRPALQPRGAGDGASVPSMARAEAAEVPSGAASGRQGSVRTFLVSKQSAAAVRKPFKRPRPAVAPSESASVAREASSSLGAAVTHVAQQVGALPTRARGGSATPSSAPPSVGRPLPVGRSPEIANFLSSTRVDDGAAGATARDGGASANGRAGSVQEGGAVRLRRRNKVFVSSYFASPHAAATPERPMPPFLNTRVDSEVELTDAKQQGRASSSLRPSLRPASPRPASARPACPWPASPLRTRRKLPSRPLSRSPSAGSHLQVEREESRSWSLPPRPKLPLPRCMLWEEKGRVLYQLSRGSSSVDGDALDWDEAAEAEADAALAEADADLARADASPSGSPAEDKDVDEQGVRADVAGGGTDMFPLLPETEEQEEITTAAIEAGAAAEVAARFGRRAVCSRAMLPSSSIGSLAQPPVVDSESSAEAEEHSRLPLPDLGMDVALPMAGTDTAAVQGSCSPVLPFSGPNVSDEYQLSAPRSLQHQLAEHRPFRSQLLGSADARVSLPLPRATHAVSPVTPAADLYSRLTGLRCSRAASVGGGASVVRRRRRPPSPPYLAAGRTATILPPSGSSTASADPSRPLVLDDPVCTPVLSMVPTPSAPQQQPMSAVDHPAGVASVSTPSDVDCEPPADDQLPSAACEQQQQQPTDGHADNMTTDNGPAVADNKLPVAGPLSTTSDVAGALHVGTSGGVDPVATDAKSKLPRTESEPEKMCPTTVAKLPSFSDGQPLSLSAGIGLSGARTSCPSADVVRSCSGALVEKPASAVVGSEPSLAAAACAGSLPNSPSGSTPCPPAAHSDSAALSDKPASVVVDGGRSLTAAARVGSSLVPPSDHSRLPRADAVLAPLSSPTQAAERTPGSGLVSAAESRTRSMVDAGGPSSGTADPVLAACMPPSDGPLARASPSPAEALASPQVEPGASSTPPPTVGTHARSPPLEVAPGSRAVGASGTPPRTQLSPAAVSAMDDAIGRPWPRLATPVVTSAGDLPDADDPARVQALLPPGGSPPRVGSQLSVASVVLSTEPDGSESLMRVALSVDSADLCPSRAPASPNERPLPGSAMSP